MEAEIREICRYLGYKKELPGEDILTEIKACREDLRRAVTPRCVYAFYDLENAPAQGEPMRDGAAQDASLHDAQGSEPDEGVIRIPGAGLELRSKALRRNLAGCKKVCLFAATLGPGPDLLIRRASVGHMSRAVILQAAAAQMIEEYCDAVCGQIARDPAAEGLYLRPRFSPGYGDLPLSIQSQIGEVLQMGKKAGIALTDGMLMVPTKSVTALIGLIPQPQPCVSRGCEECGMRDRCMYSRAG